MKVNPKTHRHELMKLIQLDHDLEIVKVDELNYLMSEDNQLNLRARHPNGQFLLFDECGSLLLESEHYIGSFLGDLVPLTDFENSRLLVYSLKSRTLVPSRIRLEGINDEFQLVPGGTFTHRLPEHTSEDYGRQLPPRDYLFRPFYCQLNLTNRETWLRVSPKKPWESHGDYYDNDYVNYPASGIDRFYCRDFLSSYSRNKGVKIRVPDEIEWEVMARSGHEGARFDQDASQYGDFKFFGLEPPQRALPKSAFAKPGAILPMLIESDRPANFWGFQSLFGSLKQWCLGEFSSDYPSVGLLNKIRLPWSRSSLFEETVFQSEGWKRLSLDALRGSCYSDAILDSFQVFQQRESSIYSVSHGIGFRLALDFDEAQRALKSGVASSVS